MADDLVTIEAAGRSARISPSAIGYWIVTGQLQAHTTEQGRMVSLSAVTRLVQQTSLPAFRHTGDPVSSSESPAIPHTSEPLTSKQLMADVTSSRPDDAVRLEFAERILRAEQRIRGLEEAVAGLRELSRKQDARIHELEARLHNGPTDDERLADQAHVEENDDEPLMTFRLLPTTTPSSLEPQPKTSGVENRSSSARRELTRLSREDEIPVPVARSEIAPQNPKEPLRGHG